MSPGNCSWRPHSDPLKSKWRGAELEPKGYKKNTGRKSKVLPQDVEEGQKTERSQAGLRQPATCT